MQVTAQDTGYPPLGQLLKLSDVATEVSVNGIHPYRQPMHCRAGTDSAAPERAAARG